VLAYIADILYRVDGVWIVMQDDGQDFGHVGSFYDGKYDIYRTSIALGV
jgi:hypothetical protein